MDGLNCINFGRFYRKPVVAALSAPVFLIRPFSILNPSRNYMKWESNRVGRETDIYSELAPAIDSLKASHKKNAPKTGSKTSSKKEGSSKKRKNGNKELSSSK